MAKCTDCGQEMQQADSCQFDHIIYDGILYERRREHFDEPGGRCHDCGIKHGGVHHFGCDVERCPKCGLQLISCGCFMGEGIQVGMKCGEAAFLMTEAKSTETNERG